MYQEVRGEFRADVSSHGGDGLCVGGPAATSNRQTYP